MNKTATTAAKKAAGKLVRRAASTNPVTAAAVTALRHRRRIVIAGVAVICAPFALVLGLLVLVAGATSDPSCAAQTVTIYDGDLAHVLATIRQLESGGNYQAHATGSTASGAYQFLDTTWAGYSGYPSAWLAPAAVQDDRAARWVTSILTSNNGDVTAVPPTWYIGHVPPVGSTEWDVVPWPSAGNVLTPRQYQDRWLTTYNKSARTMPSTTTADGAEPVAPTCSGIVATGSNTIPAGVDQLVASRVSWGGYTNGDIPTGAMRYSAHSGYLHPTASAAWDQLAAAALIDGYNLDGSGYRPATSEGVATFGRSIHGWGLAIDINTLVVGQHYPSADTAFASPEYDWLATNAARWGWINPAWAKPVALGGNGRGGYVGDSAGNLEPWHWEYAAFMNTNATPPATP